MFHSFPAQRLVEPGPEEIAQVFRAAPGALAVRFPSPIEAPGKESFRWVCRKPYALTDLSESTRSKIHRGLKRCELRLVTCKELVRLGWAAHVETLGRHGVQEAASLGFDEDLDACPAYAAWGAFFEGNLAAYIIALVVDGWAHLVVNRSSDSYLRAYPNNALLFHAVRELLGRPEISTVCHGWEPLVSHESLSHFKLSMGFVREPIRQRVLVRPRLGLLVNRPVCRVIATLARFGNRRHQVQQLGGLCEIISES